MASKSRQARGWRVLVTQQDWLLIPFIIGLGIAAYLADHKIKVPTRPVLVLDATISFKHNTDSIPFWVALVIPGVMFLICLAVIEGLAVKGPWYNRLGNGLHFLLNWLAAVGMTGFMTELFKNICGRLRPDFLQRCYPEFVNERGEFNTTLQALPKRACYEATAKGGTLKPTELDDGRKSFPSGHSSCSYAICLYAALYIAWNLYFRAATGFNRVMYNKTTVWGRLGREAISFGGLILMMAFMAFTWGVGVSRFTDNRHNASDIIAGFVLAITFVPLFFLRGIGQHEAWEAHLREEAAAEAAGSYHAHSGKELNGSAYGAVPHPKQSHPLTAHPLPNRHEDVEAQQQAERYYSFKEGSANGSGGGQLPAKLGQGGAPEVVVEQPGAVPLKGAL